jgi:hypothetical protein
MNGFTAGVLLQVMSVTAGDVQLDSYPHLSILAGRRSARAAIGMAKFAAVSSRSMLANQLPV